MAATIPSCSQEMSWAPAPCRPRARGQTLRREDSYQTNPIGPNRQAGRVARERKRVKRTQFPARLGGTGPRGRGANVQNEPNLGQPGWRPGADYAKRSQFPAPAGAVRGRRRGRCLRASQLCKTNPIWPGRGRARSPKDERCKTNPIWWGQMCETKPIAGRSAGVRGVCGAEQSQFGRPPPAAMTGRLTVSSHLRWSRLYWVATGNRRTAMERGRL